MSPLESQPTIIANGDLHNNSLDKPQSNHMHDETLEEPKAKGGQDQQCMALDLKYIIIDMAPVTFIDSSGSKMLERVSIYKYTVELLTNPQNLGLNRKKLHNKDKNFGPKRCHQYIFNL